jgi:hypothetical protein
MKVDFNNVRRSALRNFNELVKTLNKSFKPCDCSCSPCMQVCVPVGDIETSLGNLRDSLVTIGCLQDEAEGIKCVLMEGDIESVEIFNEDENV